MSLLLDRRAAALNCAGDEMSFGRHTAPIWSPSFPPELAELPQWVVWRYEYDPENPNTKPKKMPYQPKQPEYGAAPTKPDHWSSYEEAMSLWQEGTGFDGIGFVFSRDDPYCGIDLDGCVDPDTGEVAPWADAIVRRMDSYTELSVSGTGLHIIIKGKLPPARNRTGNLEMYDSKRYFTMSGVTLAEYDHRPQPIAERQAELDVLYEETFPEQESPDTEGGALPELVGRASDKSDEEIVRLMLNDLRSGERMTRLWHGDRADYASENNEGRSEADLALCGEIAYWVGSDAERIERIARLSELERSKWSERRGQSTWIQGTIAIAIRGRAKRIAEKNAPNPSSAHGRGEPTERRGLTVLTLEDMDDEPPVSWLIEGYLFEEAETMMYGAPGTGKSFLALDMALSIAYGQPWQGVETKKGAVIYLIGEGRRGLIERSRAWRAHHSHSAVHQSAPFFLIPVSFGLQDKNALAELKEKIEEIQQEKDEPVRLIVIDTLARYYEGNENSPDDATAFVNATASLRDLTGGNVMYVHHSGKDASKEAMGSTKFKAAVNTEMKVTRDDSGYMTLTVTKHRDGETGGKMTLMSRPVLFTRKDGTEDTSLVVEKIDAPLTASPLSTLSNLQRLTYNILDEFGAMTYSEWQKRVEEESDGKINKDKFNTHRTALRTKKLVEKREDERWQVVRREEPNTGGGKNPTPF